MSFFRNKELNKKVMPKKKKETKFKVFIGLDGGDQINIDKLFTEEEAKKRVEEIKQTKGKYFCGKDGRFFIERKRILHAFIQESD